MASQLKTELILNDSNFNAKLSSATKKAQASLNQISQTSKGLSGVLGGFSGQLGGLTSQLQGFLGASKLLTNPWTAAAAAIGASSVAFFNYNKNLAETKDLVQQFTGLSGASLDSLRNNIQAVSDATGKDFRDVLSGVDGLMSQFGISGETALKIIQDGFVAGTDDSGQFLENLSKYSGAFNDIGVSADELTALLAQTRNGIFSEDGMDAIQMAGKNIRTMSNSAKQSLAAIGISGDDMIRKLSSGQMTTMDAIRQISGALKKLPPQSQEVGNVLQDVFGKKGSQAGYELITSLEGISTNLEEVKKQTGEDGEIMDELIKTTKNFNAALESLFGVSEAGFDDMADQLKTSVLKALTKVINKFIDLYNKSYLVRGAIAALEGAFRSLWNATRTILGHLADLLLGTFHILEGIVTLDFKTADLGASQVVKGLDLGTFAREVVDGVQKGFTDAFNKHWDNQITRVEVQEEDETEYGKTTGKGGSGRGNSGSGKSGSGKGNSGSSSNNPTFAAGSLSDLENKLSELQKKYKDGLINITPEDYKKQVSDLEKQIKEKKISLYLDTKSLDQQLKELQDNQKSEDISLHLDTSEYYKKEAEIKKQIQKRDVDIMFSVDENSLAGLQRKISDLEENQVSENVYLHLDAEEYKRQHKELEHEIEQQKIKLGVSLSLDDLNKEYNQVMKDFSKKSSFETAIGKPEINSSDYEGQLTNVQEQMDANDQLLSQLKQLKEAYEELGLTGSDGYQTIKDKIGEVNQEQQTLGTTAYDLNKKIQEQQNLTKSLNESSDALSNLGSLFSTVGQATDDPTAQIAGIIASSIANIVQGASKAIAQAGSLGPFGFAAAGLGIMAQVASMIAQIHSISGYAQGGINPGKVVGDKNIIRVNGNEAILNTGQQRRLWNLINGSEMLGYQPTISPGKVEFKIRGSDLVGVFNNHNKKRSKVI